MPLSLMQPLSRPPSRDLDASATKPKLSKAETYHLAVTARRKSSDKLVREDLRLKLSHDHLLELLLQDIAKTEREVQTSPTEDKYLSARERRSTATHQTIQRQLEEPTSPTSPTEEMVDDYGFPMEEEEEDFGGLALMRTESRRPVR